MLEAPLPGVLAVVDKDCSDDIPSRVQSNAIFIVIVSSGGLDFERAVLQISLLYLPVFNFLLPVSFFQPFYRDTMYSTTPLANQ